MAASGKTACRKPMLFAAIAVVSIVCQPCRLDAERQGKNMRIAAILAAGAFASMLAISPALSIEPVAPTYLVAMKIHDGDRLVGSPRLTIAAGHPSTIEIAETAGNRYTVTMTATSQPGGTVYIRSKIDVVSGGVHQALSPNMLVKLNESSAIAFGTESATSKPVRVDFTLNKVG